MRLYRSVEFFVLRSVEASEYFCSKQIFSDVFIKTFFFKYLIYGVVNQNILYCMSCLTTLWFLTPKKKWYVKAGSQQMHLLHAISFILVYSIGEMAQYMCA